LLAADYSLPVLVAGSWLLTFYFPVADGSLLAPGYSLMAADSWELFAGGWLPV